MEHEVEVLREQLKINDERDERIRSHLSKFLGSYKRDRFSVEDEVKVLRWPEIYFELGKLKANYQELSDDFGLRNEIKQAFNLINILNKEVFKKEEEQHGKI